MPPELQVVCFGVIYKNLNMRGQHSKCWFIFLALRGIFQNHNKAQRISQENINASGKKLRWNTGEKKINRVLTSSHDKPGWPLVRCNWTSFAADWIGPCCRCLIVWLAVHLSKSVHNRREASVIFNFLSDIFPVRNSYKPTVLSLWFLSPGRQLYRHLLLWSYFILFR